jgi:phosphoglycolate phosphatase-like HAD superfamily hydrolase
MEVNKFSALLWDFDGVLMDSMAVRDMGFELVLQHYPAEQVALLMQYHRQNGGFSRYVKFRYFFEVIRGEKVSDDQINDLASAFSVIMRERLADTTLLIEETVAFVRNNYQIVPMYIVSGSDQNELRYLCKTFEIDTFFKGIFGSPTPKKELVKGVIENLGDMDKNCLLIGDSINDFDAAVANNIDFMAYNNPDLNEKSTSFINLKLVN